MTTRRALLLGMAGAAVTAGGMPASAQLFKRKAPAGKEVVPATAKGGRVIVLRGLYNIFSRGMDAIAAKFATLGVTVTLENHAHWNRIAEDLRDQYTTQENVAPIIFVGHSLGADASLVMANWLGLHRVPVRLIVTFDGVAQLHPVTANVEEIVNFYKPKGYGQEVEVTEHFKGNLNNVDLTERRDIDHLNIDKDPVLQEEVIAKVLAVLGVEGQAGAPAAPAAGPAAPAGAAAPAGPGAPAGPAPTNAPVPIPRPANRTAG